ncbi:hypothetical protein TWF281_005386 [Arthrobotrys megalospora]
MKVTSLPTEIQFHIFSYLCPVERAYASLVCKTWQNIALTDKLFRYRHSHEGSNIQLHKLLCDHKLRLTIQNNAVHQYTINYRRDTDLSSCPFLDEPVFHSIDSESTDTESSKEEKPRPKMQKSYSTTTIRPAQSMAPYEQWSESRFSECSVKHDIAPPINPSSSFLHLPVSLSVLEHIDFEDLEGTISEFEYTISDETTIRQLTERLWKDIKTNLDHIKGVLVEPNEVKVHLSTHGNKIELNLRANRHLDRESFLAMCRWTGTPAPKSGSHPTPQPRLRPAKSSSRGRARRRTID